MASGEGGSRRSRCRPGGARVRSCRELECCAFSRPVPADSRRRARSSRLVAAISRFGQMTRPGCSLPAGRSRPHTPQRRLPGILEADPSHPFTLYWGPAEAALLRVPVIPRAQ
jgi:hypothetical protein